MIHIPYRDTVTTTNAPSKTINIERCLLNISIIYLQYCKGFNTISNFKFSTENVGCCFGISFLFQIKTRHFSVIPV